MCSLATNPRNKPTPNRQIADLEAAVETGDPRAIAAAVAATHAGRAAATAAAADKIAAKRSGLRGLKARRIAIETQEQARTAKARADAAAAKAGRGADGGFLWKVVGVPCVLPVR